MIKENTTLLNALVSDLQELGDSTVKFDEALNSFDTNTVKEFLTHYQEVLTELLDSIADIEFESETQFGVILS